MRFWVVFVCLAIFLASLFINNTVFAQKYEEGYFDFSLNQYILFDGANTEVEFIWDINGFDMLNQKRFLVRPFVSLGFVEIFNTETSRFVPFNDLNTNLPYLRNTMTIRLKGIANIQDSFWLYFLIYDNVSGKIYKTQSRKVWSSNYYSIYRDLLNQAFESSSSQGFNTFKESNYRSDSANQSDLSEQSSFLYKNPPKIYLWYFGPAVFIYGLIKSLNASDKFG